MFLGRRSLSGKCLSLVGAVLVLTLPLKAWSTDDFDVFDVPDFLDVSDSPAAPDPSDLTAPPEMLDVFAQQSLERQLLRAEMVLCEQLIPSSYSSEQKEKFRAAHRERARAFISSGVWKDKLKNPIGPNENADHLVQELLSDLSRLKDHVATAQHRQKLNLNVTGGTPFRGGEGPSSGEEGRIRLRLYRLVAGAWYSGRPLDLEKVQKLKTVSSEHRRNEMASNLLVLGPLVALALFSVVAWALGMGWGGLAVTMAFLVAGFTSIVNHVPRYREGTMSLQFQSLSKELRGSALESTMNGLLKKLSEQNSSSPNMAPGLPSQSAETASVLAEGTLKNLDASSSGGGVGVSAPGCDEPLETVASGVRVDVSSLFESSEKLRVDVTPVPSSTHEDEVDPSEETSSALEELRRGGSS